MRTTWLIALFLVAGCQCDDTPAGGPTPTNRSPVATITSPRDGAVFSAGADVALRGQATDVEDGPLPGTALAWRSSLDGALGGGEALQVALSEGVHEITLTATDSAGAIGADTIVVEQRGANQPPAPVITSPADNTVLVEGTPLVLSGTADDPEEGPLPGSALSWSSSLDGAIGVGSSASLDAPSLGQHLILLTAVDSGGLAGHAAINVEIVPLGTNLDPIATITAPTAGQGFVDGDTVTFAGTGVDPEDGALSGADLEWASDLDGTLGTGSPHEDSSLTLGVHRITLTVSDSEGATGSDQITISVNPPGNEPPQASITAPADGSVFAASDTVNFAGSANDAEDGALADNALEWNSDLDGVLGTGALVPVDNLSVGGHRITLVATDSGSATGTDEIGITVLAPNTDPVVTITSPTSGSSSELGDPVLFEGIANDAEDGALSGTSVRWSSSLDGLFGNGTALSFSSLTVGNHRVTLTATDSGGGSGSDFVDITVEPAAVNLDPVAQLTGPAQAWLGATAAFDGSASYDADGTIVDFEFDFGDGSPVQSGAADGADHIFSELGTWTVTLTVTDDDAATGVASLEVEVVEQVRVPEVVWDADGALGSMCAIAVDDANSAHVVFRGDTHAQLWYARDTGSEWTTELVDGPGLDVGATVSDAMSLAIDASGRAHVAYRYLSPPYEIRYARRDAGGWVRERVDSTWASKYNSRVAVALDPVNGERPLVVYTFDSGTEYPIVAYRTGAGAWTEEQLPAAYTEWDFTGGLAFDSSGLAWLSFGTDDRFVATWSATGGFSAEQLVYADTTDAYFAPLALDDIEQPYVLHQEGIEHRVAGSWVHSEVENFDTGYHHLAVGPSGMLWVLIRHGGELELVSANPGGYFERLYQGPMDASQGGVTVGSDGEPRACFFRDNNLIVY